MALKLRPLELGELIDRAFTLWRAHWKTLFPLVLGFQLVTYAMTKALAIFANERFPLMNQGGEAMTEAYRNNRGEAWLQLAGLLGASSITMLVLLWVSTVSSTAQSHWLYPTVVGGPALSLREAFAAAMKKLGRISAASLWAAVWTVAFSALLMLPGGLMLGLGMYLLRATQEALAPVGAIVLIIATLVMLAGIAIALLWSLIRFSVISQVLALENLSGWGTFRRCGALTSGRITAGFFGFVKVRLAVLVTLTGVLLILINQLAGAPVWVLYGIYGNGFDLQNLRLEQIPPYFLVPAELLQHTVMSVVLPVYTATQLLFYVDVRVRREGLDLQLKLDETKAAA
ncbi:MAG: hypothetical protein K1X64_19160 [Myxococcaceae bacterium]|nr:hypothetical protein [Myxococcaceae bacterium]